MLVVLSSLYDPHVTPGLAHWKAAKVDVRVITCHDLARPGWRLTLDDNPTLVIDGDRVPARAVRGVVSRLSWVTSHELPFIAEPDREYAAAEMQAFLLALLTQLKCPVINRPTPGCLSGPAWSPERWTMCAAEQRIAVQPIVRRAYAGGAVVDPPRAPDRRVVNVVGERVIGDVPKALHDAALAVAREAGCDLLRVAFVASARTPVFIDADTWVDLSDAEVAAAVAKRFES
jgi:hypothetical protein